MKFAITGLPRSRTKWASVFLSTPDCPVIHDASVEQFGYAKAVSTPMVITHWTRIPEDTKIVLINRPLQDSLSAMSIYDVSAKQIRDLEVKKYEMISNRDVLILDYYNLDAKKMYEYCHGVPVSDEYVKVFEDMNITQQSMSKIRRIA